MTEKNFHKSICPGDSKITTNKKLVQIDDGSVGGSNWVCFIHVRQQIKLLSFVW